VTRHLELREFLLGVEGLALCRYLFTADDAAAQQRVEEIRRIVADERLAVADAVPLVEVAEGYARWSTRYDDPMNPLISVEQPVVWGLLERIAPRRALDAACGTGRHTRRLVELGHEVTGIDATIEMLSLARDKLPGADLREGDLLDLPLEDRRFDLAVCALALEHVDDLERALSELARVVRPGGRVIVSDMHPVLRALGGAAFFRDAAGERAVIRGRCHTHSDYLNAFAQAGLVVNRCLEAGFGQAEVEMQQPAATIVPEATRAAFLGLPAVLVWDLERPAR
jgi:ubiquinone/menaquinone biosynthesis C-methylase UbiE